jgi:hypothetical protein
VEVLVKVVFFNRLGFGSYLLLVSMLIEMASSIITDLWSFFQRQDLPSSINDSVGRLNFSRYGPSNLLRQIDLGSFLMVAARSIILAIFVPATTSSTMVVRALSSLAMSVTFFWYTGVATLADGD